MMELVRLATKMEGRMNGKDYIRLLSRHLLPLYMQSMGSSYVLIDDKAPCHRSQTVIRWIFKCFRTFDWYCIYTSREKSILKMQKIRV